MSQLALNNLSSLAGASVASPTAAGPGNDCGFDDHLQRASQDGTGGNGEQEVGVWTSSPLDAAPESSAINRNSDSQSTSGSQTSPTASSKDSDALHREDSDEHRNQTSKDHAPPETGQAAATAYMAIPSALVATQEAATAPIGAAEQTAVNSATSAKTAAIAGTAQSGACPTAAESLVAGQTIVASLNAGENAALTQETTTAPITNSQPGVADAVSPVNVQQSAPTQPSQPPAAAANPDASLTQALATAGLAAAGRAKAAPGAAKSAGQSASVNTATPADQAKSPRSDRAAESGQRSAISAQTDVQAAAAAAVAVAGNEAAPQSKDTTLDSTRKDSGSPAIDAVSAKTQPAGTGQSPGNASALPKATAGPPQATPSTTSAGASEVDRVRFLQRVSSAFQAADEQGGQIRLRLSPPELGAMRLELSVRNGVMTAHVQTETDAARNMLLDHLPQLRDRLADHNIKIDHFDVELTNQSRSGTPQNFAGNADQRQPAAPNGAARSRTSGDGAVPAAIPAVGLRTVNGRLDVTV